MALAAGEDICAVFRAADQAAYSGHSLSAADLQHWQQRVDEQLKLLEAL